MAHLNNQNLYQLGRNWSVKWKSLLEKLQNAESTLNPILVEFSEWFLRDQWDRQVEDVTTKAPGKSPV
jgi:hypothetical protein